MRHAHVTFSFLPQIPFALAVSGRPAEHESVIIELSGLVAAEAMRLALPKDGRKSKRDSERKTSA
jgi:hypothetical protein